MCLNVEPNSYVEQLREVGRVRGLRMHDGRVQLLDKVEDSDGSVVGFKFRRCFDFPRVLGQSGHLRVFLSASS